VIFGGDLASRGAERGDVVEESVLGFGRQIHQQSLGTPGRRFGVVETAGAQRGRPIVAQIDADRAALCRRLGTEARHGFGFKCDDPGLVDLVDDAAGRPVQPIGPGVQPGGQDHGLLDARRRRIGEELVEEPCPHRQRVGFGLQFRGAVLTGSVFRDRSYLAVDHAGEELDAHRADQRGGERVVDNGVGVPGGQRPGCRDHRRGGAHAGGEVPTIGIAARHAHPSGQHSAVAI
jgi:hypothetical protein